MSVAQRLLFLACIPTPNQALTSSLSPRLCRFKIVSTLYRSASTSLTNCHGCVFGVGGGRELSVRTSLLPTASAPSQPTYVPWPRLRCNSPTRHSRPLRPPVAGPPSRRRRLLHPGGWCVCVWVWVGVSVSGVCESVGACTQGALSSAPPTQRGRRRTCPCRCCASTCWTALRWASVLQRAARSRNCLQLLGTRLGRRHGAR